MLHNLTLAIRPGEKIGLVGRSGAGKSTLVNALLRFYNLDSGEIRIDGQNIADVTQDSLRRHIAMVTQDTSLLHRSVRDNILYGRPDASEAELQHAIAQAEAGDFIAELSDQRGNTGLDAQVGERGVKLSGGQRQRIAIARVLLKDAPILILDEATSALDSEVEAAIQQSLNQLMQGKTVIAIAHRLSTIAAMDPSSSWMVAASSNKAATTNSSPRAASTRNCGRGKPAVISATKQARKRNKHRDSTKEGALRRTFLMSHDGVLSRCSLSENTESHSRTITAHTKSVQCPPLTPQEILI